MSDLVHVEKAVFPDDTWCEPKRAAIPLRPVRYDRSTCEMPVGAV